MEHYENLSKLINQPEYIPFLLAHLVIKEIINQDEVDVINDRCKLAPESVYCQLHQLFEKRLNGSAHHQFEELIKIVRENGVDVLLGQIPEMLKPQQRHFPISESSELLVVGEKLQIGELHHSLISCPSAHTLAGPAVLNIGNTLGLPTYFIYDLRRRLHLGEITWSLALRMILEKWAPRKSKHATLLRLRVALTHNNLHDISVFLEQKYSGIVAIPYQRYDPDMLRKTLPESVPNYVNRMLRSRCVLTDKIFDKEEFYATCLLSGITISQLGALVGSSKIGTSTQKLLQDDFKAQFIVLEHESHRKMICDKMTGALLNLGDDKKLRLVESRNSVICFQDLLAEETKQDIMSEDELMERIERTGQRSVCIAAGPGMGKSSILSEIGRRLLASYPNKDVVYLSLLELARAVQVILEKTPDQEMSIQMALENLLCKDDRSKVYLRERLLQNEKQIMLELLLDDLYGVEDQCVHKRVVHNILETISLHIRSIRLWVTCHPQHLKELEISMHVLGYRVCPFSYDDQLRYLVSRWTHFWEDFHTEKITEFAKECLQNLQTKASNLTSEILGVPLICHMMAEVFEKSAHAFPRSNSTNSATSEHFHISSTCDLFEQFIQKKLTDYKKLQGKLAVEDNVMIEMHVKMALDLLFPDRNFLPMVNVNVEEMQNVGLMDTSGYVGCFYAEYLVARYVVDKLAKCDEWTEEINTIFMEKLMAVEEFTFGSILPYETTSGWKDYCRYERSYKFAGVFPNYLNSMVKEILPNENFAIDVSNTKFLEILGKFLQACVHADCVNLCKILIQSCRNIENDTGKNFLESHFDLNLVQMAAQATTLPFFQWILSHFETFHEFNLTSQWRCLHVAVRRGYLEMVEFLLHERDLRSHLVNFGNLSLEAKELLHQCTVDTCGDSADIIEEKIKIARLLCETTPSFLKHRLDFRNETPLLCYRVHPRFLQELIRLGADILARDKYDSTVLHLPSSWNSGDYHSLISSIPVKDVRKLVQAVESYGGYTPLQKMINCLDLLPETLNFFKTCDANFNHCNKQGYSILATALESERSESTISTLIKCGADPVPKLPLSRPCRV